MSDKWQPVETAPKKTWCLFYSPGNPHAVNANATEPYCQVDRFSGRWPTGILQCLEAPYTLWQIIDLPTQEQP